MLAVAQWLFEEGALRVLIHPDGMHVKDFDLASWLHNNDFRKIKSIGKTPHGGVYESGERTVEVRFQPGRGDVVAQLGAQRVVVEAKGGCLNSRHPGLLSKLRRHLHEAVGSLFNPPEADRLIAAVPQNPETAKLARRMASRCHAAASRSPSSHPAVPYPSPPPQPPEPAEEPPPVA